MIKIKNVIGKIRTKFFVYCVLCLVFLPSFCFFTFITPVFAQGEDYGLSFTAEQASLAANPNLPHLIGGILGTVLSLVGILFFALMLYGGITWMTARGAADQEKKALSTITAAIIGILIVLGSYAITQFVFKAIQATGGK